MTTQTYQDAALHLLQQAETELELGDTRQASEKGWGAAVQAVKAVCELRGWRHRSYKALQRAVRNLQEETADDDIRLLFGSAYILHVNFYEDDEDPEFVAERIADVHRFIDKLDSLA